MDSLVSNGCKIVNSKTNRFKRLFILTGEISPKINKIKEFEIF
jgi:glycine cleavage system regulatory protein